jgi:hypothetical protein
MEEKEKEIKMPIVGSTVKNKNTDDRYLVVDIRQRERIGGFKFLLDRKGEFNFSKNVGQMEFEDRYLLIEYE